MGGQPEEGSNLKDRPGMPFGLGNQSPESILLAIGDAPPERLLGMSPKEGVIVECLKDKVSVAIDLG